VPSPCEAVSKSLILLHSLSVLLASQQTLRCMCVNAAGVHISSLIIADEETTLQWENSSRLASCIQSDCLFYYCLLGCKPDDDDFVNCNGTEPHEGSFEPRCFECYRFCTGECLQCVYL